MNWPLVALLSLAGVMMGLLSVRGHTRGIEPYLWAVLAIFAAIVIARTAGGRPFLHGLATGAAWGLLNGAVAAALFPIYRRHNPEVMARIAGSGVQPGGPADDSSRWMFLLGALPIGLGTGLVLGLLALLAGRVIREAPSPG
ncbi:MAG TPA: hypothetical protein VD963_09275 [Phycisphaerales bacterium]|nr:hypothetical protein [Phycisphaerales bacterium]